MFYWPDLERRVFVLSAHEHSVTRINKNMVNAASKVLYSFKSIRPL